MSAELDCQADAAAYVLGAMDEPEAQAFGRHLRTCAACQAEVENLEGAVAALPAMVPQLEPPATLRKRVMAEVRADGQRRSPAAGRFPPSLAWSRPRRMVGGLAAAAAVGIAAAVVVIVLVAGGSSTRVITAAITWHHGSAALKLTGQRGELVVTGMPAPPPDHIYEVWVKRGDRTPAPTAALFDVNRSGQADVDVPGDLHGVTAVLVTPEPSGGTKVPTAGPVLVANLS